ncbi:transposase [Klebsiella pneumoniae]|uniref:helix-turn-helix domain-containing protein n=1 Tax=Klebsiella pneumoniae TaxID=573 RepID=UPI0009C71D3C|nr:transposase [Klebsiella pneumoniae]SLW21296.1 transposase [Klebsiella pneumoniae]SLW26613.1 transposase [Klebsiella pneumoniae]SLW50704.1 transposase [Klebsiella pneumoniae]SLX03446.1 transposase [Klebsiella pneumoniae]
MSAESSGVFTLKEINRIKIIQDVIERRITTRRAAEHLGISDRQCRRLIVSQSKDSDDGSCTGIFTLDEVNRL